MAGSSKISFTRSVVGIACAFTLTAYAQPVPTPEVRQQGERQERRLQEREEAQRSALQRSPDAAAPTTLPSLKPWPADESPCLPIREIALAGEASESFQWALDGLRTGDEPAMGRCLGVDGINVAADRVQRALLERGFVTSRVLLTMQDLSSGHLTFTLFPGRIRAIRFAEGVGIRATAINAVPAKPGDILNLRDIEQGLENFKRVPTASADIQIVPAERPDESDLVISWQQSFPFRLTATADDSGTKATGKYQGSATVSYDHWLTLNDLLYATVSHDLGGGDAGARGTRGHTVHYSIPWDYWLLGITSTKSDYHQTVAGLNQDYVYSGNSQNADLKLSRLVYRDAVRKTTLSLKGWLKRSANFIDDSEVTTQRRATGGWELGLSHREFIDRATLDIQLSHKRGTAAFNGQPASESPDEGTARMRITALEASLAWPLRVAGQALSYQGTFRGQWNGTPLTSQDRFAIGGRYTVRGFDGESSLSAERGWLVRNELGVALGSSGQQAYVGLDYGQVRGPFTDWLVGRHLAGAVMGLRGGAKSVTYDFFVGKPVSKPAYFRTASTTAGFSFNAAF